MFNDKEVFCFDAVALWVSWVTAMEDFRKRVVLAFTYSCLDILSML